MKTILMLGANSGMARATLRLLAGPEVRLILASRNVKELEKTANDLVIRKNAPQPLVIEFDAAKTQSHAGVLDQVLKKAGPLDEVYLFFGQLHDQKEAQKDERLANEMLVTNYVGALSILERVAQHMEAKRAGLIVGVSSVAGDRGRQSNYLYGSAKAGLTAYLQGLRNRLAKSGVHVLTVKPGFVATAMTAHLKGGLLFASPDTVARGIVKAAKQKKNVAYVPTYWRWIMLIVRMIPESLFKKLSM